MKISRRSLLTAAAASPLLRSAGKRIPIGLELYSVRSFLEKDLEGSIRKVAEIGYQTVEIYSYFNWTPEKAKEIRKLLDDLKISCVSTHNSLDSFKPEGIQKAIDLNGILGSRFVILASAGDIKDLDGWKRIAELLTNASERLAPAKLRPGYHNHQLEFRELDGKRPMEVIAANTPKNVVLQLDVGHCIQTGADPVAWIDANPGRINSVHLKDWSPEKKYEALFGEGIVPWKKVFEAAEKTGGVESYLIEWEGVATPPFEAVKKCLETYKKIHG
jgi:sugar phosphate isomerase/epimerase